jgi:hypothetical protein
LPFYRQLPEAGVDFYLAKDVLHGEVSIRWYVSKITGLWRRAYVYTPPDYDTRPQQRYPVLYLRHGGGEDETGWTKQGQARRRKKFMIREPPQIRRRILWADGLASSNDKDIQLKNKNTLLDEG